MAFRIALVVRWIWTLILGCVGMGAAFANINWVSPGPLAKPHEKLEGMSQCSQCHEAGRQVTAQKCLDCHQPLRDRIERRTGYHGRMTDKQMQCASCHPDHAGGSFEMIQWEPSKEKFDHTQTGYPLKGAHTKVRCETCHDSRLIVDEDILEARRQGELTRTYLGASTQCRSCHYDEHRGQLSLACETCHTEVSWKKTPRFNHARTSYPLTGKHKTVACVKCHALERDLQATDDLFPKPKSRRYARYKGIVFQSCEDCHRDVHEGKFGPQCDSCHKTSGWKNLIADTTQDRAFHEKTRYPLRGAHIRTPCKSCHGPYGKEKARYKNLAFGKCQDCHADAHQGQLKGDCDTCHTLQSFSEVAYTRESHQRSRYPLEGAHRATMCYTCHAKRLKPSTAAWKRDYQRKERKILESLAQYRFKSNVANCETCHKDPHRQQFRGPDGRVRACSSCHLLSSFKLLRFDHNTETRFPLRGKHLETPCQSCHQPKKKGAVIIYKAAPLECYACHDDVHMGQFNAPGTTHSPCQVCHQESSFKKDLRFDHNDKRFSRYPLLGKHLPVPCEKCHPAYQVKPGLRVVRYKPLPMACADCHDDTHKGQFDRFTPTNSEGRLP